MSDPNGDTSADFRVLATPICWGALLGLYQIIPRIASMRSPYIAHMTVCAEDLQAVVY